jgi:hypothetical protein
MKSNSKEEVSRFTYQFDLERKITLRTPSGCVVEGEKKGEKTKGPCMLIYRMEAGVFRSKM